MRKLVLPILLLACHSAFAQDFELGAGLPVELSLKDLETGKFGALRLSGGDSSAMGNMFSMMTSPIFMLMGAFSSTSDGSAKNSEMAIFSLLELSWTTGQKTEWMGSTFLVTYKFDLDASVMSKPEPPKPDEIRFGLTLVKTSSITSVSPKPKVTPGQIRDMLQAMADKEKSMPSVMVVPMDAAKDSASAAPAEARDSATEAAAPASQSTDRVEPRSKFYDEHGVVKSGSQNLLSVMNGLRAYATKHKGQLPLTNNNDKLRRAFSDLGMEIGWSTQNPRGSEFVFNPHIRGRHISKLPSDMPFVWDSKTNGGTRLVGFTGGRVEILTEGEFQNSCRKYKIVAK